MAVAPKATQATEYIVLERRTFKDPDDCKPVKAWVEVGAASGTTRQGVVGNVAGENGGVYRPVPARNWQKPIRWREKVDRRDGGRGGRRR